MEDNKIIELYWNRNEAAVVETDKKYGKYCSSIAYNILKNDEDSKECVNDTYLHTWNSIPPQKPNILKLFLGKITRNLALNMYEKKKAQKRNSELEVILGEIETITHKSQEDVEEMIKYNELVNILNEFVDDLPIQKRRLFLDRYFQFDSIKEIARKNNMKENNVKVTLMRIRNELEKYLKEGGIYE